MPHEKAIANIYCIYFLGLPARCKPEASIQPKILPVIVVQPLDNFDSATLQQIQAGIAAFYPVKVVIAQRTNFPQKAWYAPRKRYRADSTIAWLKTIQPANTRCILAITKQDISTTKGQITDFGVMGLGYQPGVSCVVSLYRLRGGGVGDSVVYNRFLKTILHELGHNFGLPHCPDKTCIMADAEGKLSQDKEQGLCNTCLHKIKI